MNWSKQMTKTFFMSLLLLGFGTYYLIIDYSSMPSKEDDMWNGIFEPVTYREFNDPSKSMTISLGDGFISNIESIFIHISFLFGAFRLVDFLFMFKPKTEINLEKYRKIINKIKNKYSMEKK